MSYRFVSDYRRFSFKVPRSDPDHDYVRSRIHTGMFSFDDIKREGLGVYETDDERMAQFLRRMIRSRGIAAREDLSQMPLPCPIEGCEWRSDTSGPAGQQERYEHLLDAHGDRFLGGPVKPKSSGGRGKKVAPPDEDIVEEGAGAVAPPPEDSE